MKLSVLMETLGKTRCHLTDDKFQLQTAFKVCIITLKSKQLLGRVSGIKDLWPKSDIDIVSLVLSCSLYSTPASSPQATAAGRWFVSGLSWLQIARLRSICSRLRLTGLPEREKLLIIVFTMKPLVCIQYLDECTRE